MIVDPWGKVLADCGGFEDNRICDNVDGLNGVVKVASIDLNRLRKIRREMPIWNHRRKDIYGEIEAKFYEPRNDRIRTEWEMINDGKDENPRYRFGTNVVLSPNVVFVETPLSFAFVNRKPVLPGHVLVAPKRMVARMKEVGR